MPRKHSSKRRQRGGLFGFGESDSSSTGSSNGSWFSGLTSSASGLTSKFKNPFSSQPASTSPSVVQPQQATTMMTSESASSYGGKKRKTRKMRGGYSDNVSASSLASNSASLKGGKSRKRRQSRKR
jgi:hypothetical protein